MKEFYKGEYVVHNKEKYIGNKNPIYRSSWEARFCNFLDMNSVVTKWGYECLEITYFNVIDKKMHRYYPDFYFEMFDKNNERKKYMIEVKPLTQTIPPKEPKNKTKRSMKTYIYESHRYVVNQCKWEAAKNFCIKNGIEFKIITENELFNKGV